MKRGIALALMLLILVSIASAEDRNLLLLARDLDATLEWDPLRDAGVLSFGNDRIALGVGSTSALVNYRRKVEIDPPVRKDGAVWLTTSAVSAISDAVQKDRLESAAEHVRVAYILIDPGHGGKDSGSVGSYMVGKTKTSLREKDVTLKISRKLVSLLTDAFPDKQIIATRSDDTFVSLESRTDLANAFLDKTKDTVLFVSIHANASVFKLSNANGYEVWLLPPTYSRTLLDAKKAGTDLDILPIVNSMFEEEISVESTMLAQRILAGLDAKIGSLSMDRGLRQNDWYVVRNARMPAVLTEVGFVSNQDEAARLADDAYLNKVAEGLYAGISAFIARFERNEIADAR